MKKNLSKETVMSVYEDVIWFPQGKLDILFRWMNPITTINTDGYDCRVYDMGDYAITVGNLPFGNMDLMKFPNLIDTVEDIIDCDYDDFDTPYDNVNVHVLNSVCKVIRDNYNRRIQEATANIDEYIQQVEREVSSWTEVCSRH